jgi:hypothetical protein
VCARGGKTNILTAKGEFDKDDEKFLVDFERKGWEEEKEENDNKKDPKPNQINYNYGEETKKTKGWEEEEEKGGSDTKGGDSSSQISTFLNYFCVFILLRMLFNCF